MLVLESYHRISHKVVKVEFGGLDRHFRMLLPEEPSDMCEKESPVCVVWVPVRFTELVMDSMITAPDVQGVLACDTLADHQEDTQRQSCLIGAVGPQPVSPCRDPHPAGHPDPVACSIIVTVRSHRSGENCEPFLILTCHQAVCIGDGPVGGMEDEPEGVEVEEAGEEVDGDIGPDDVKGAGAHVNVVAVGRLDEVGMTKGTCGRFQLNMLMFMVGMV